MAFGGGRVEAWRQRPSGFFAVHLFPLSADGLEGER